MDKREEKTEKILEQTNTSEINVNVTYTDESAVKDGSLISSLPRVTYEYSVQTVNPETGEIINTDAYCANGFSYMDDRPKDVLSLDDVRTFYKNNDCSAEKTYDYLKNYIIENKDNPAVLQAVAESVLGNLESIYDSTQEHKKVGESQTDILDKIMNTPENGELSGMICGPIHEFVMNTLHDCGINAAMLMGKNEENHVTLLYQRSDGKYVFNNYGTTAIIDADNIKDAARTVLKHSPQLDSCGYITIADSENSYQEFAFRDEAAFGHEMDKRDYNDRMPSDFNTAKKSSLTADINTSSLGSISVRTTGTMAHSDDSRSTEASVALEYRNTAESSMFANSQSIGLRGEYKGLNQNDSNTETFFDIKGIASYTKGDKPCFVQTLSEDNNQYLSNRFYNTIDPKNHREEGPEITENDLIWQSGTVETKNISVFVNGSAGMENTLIETDNLRLTNTSECSAYIGGTAAIDTGTGIFGDMRLLAENELRLQNRAGDFSFDNSINAGITGDLKLNTAAVFGFQPGVKLNAASSVSYKPEGENFEIGAGIRGYGVLSSPAKDRGVSANIYSSIKPDGSEITYYGAVSGTLEKQNLNIGGFNHLTENNSTVSAVIGAKINPKTALNISYSHHSDALNKSRNNSAVSIGACINF